MSESTTPASFGWQLHNARIRALHARQRHPERVYQPPRKGRHMVRYPYRKPSAWVAVMVGFGLASGVLVLFGLVILLIQLH